MPRADEESSCHAIERRLCPHSPGKRPSVRPGQLPTRATTTDRRRCRCCLQSHVQARRSRAKPKNAARRVSGAASRRRARRPQAHQRPRRSNGQRCRRSACRRRSARPGAAQSAGAMPTSSCPARAKKSCDCDSKARTSESLRPAHWSCMLHSMPRSSPAFRKARLSSDLPGPLRHPEIARVRLP